MERTETGTSGRRVVILVGIAVILVAGYFGAGMPGMDHSGGGMAGMSMSEPVALEPDAFAERLDGDVVLIDVHTPPAQEGIAGTDLRVSAERVTDAPDLPTDLDVPILLYCRTGKMSSDAASALVNAGYRDVAYLEGGTVAWADAGLPLESVEPR